MPGLSVTSYIIEGFPTETPEEFAQTLDLVRTAGFDQLFTFMYSRRKGTPADRMEGQVDRAEKQRRFGQLIELQNEISRRINDACIGKTYRVLVEGPSKTDPAVMTGRTDEGKIVNFRCAEHLPGRFIRVTIVSAQTWSLWGEIRE
jgi:tRNA-2-methylthio-N6-dimethylallyladenosine synthase